MYLDILYSDKLNTIQKEKLQMKLWQLLGKRTERYTMGDSSSVPVEIAEELFKSICFSLKKVADDERLIEEDLDDILKISWTLIESDINKGKKLLEEVKRLENEIDNISYKDTIREIEQSFNRYDYRFFAHEITCSIDYQLSNAVSEELQGIEYINEYLKRLVVENKFCKFFKREYIIKILASYCDDYKELLINIYEPIITNAVGLEILGNDILKLEVTEEDRKVLFNEFYNHNVEEIKKKLRAAAIRIFNRFMLNNKFEREYMKNTVDNLVYRIIEGINANNLENIFLSFKENKENKEEVFISNNNMQDEMLRYLIEEIKSCRYIEDKIAIIKNEINSLADLIEILNTTIWDEEQQVVFNELGSEIIYLLKKYLEKNNIQSETKWEQKIRS